MKTILFNKFKNNIPILFNITIMIGITIAMLNNNKSWLDIIIANSCFICAALIQWSLNDANKQQEIAEIEKIIKETTIEINDELNNLNSITKSDEKVIDDTNILYNCSQNLEEIHINAIKKIRDKIKTSSILSLVEIESFLENNYYKLIAFNNFIYFQYTPDSDNKIVKINYDLDILLDNLIRILLSNKESFTKYQSIEEWNLQEKSINEKEFIEIMKIKNTGKYNYEFYKKANIKPTKPSFKAYVDNGKHDNNFYIFAMKNIEHDNLFLTTKRIINYLIYKIKIYFLTKEIDLKEFLKK